MLRMIPLLLFMAGFAATFEQPGTPSIAFDRLEIYLGDITAGEPIRGVFGFSNQGAGILKILGVEPS